jgi:hypothetical protein
MKPMTISALTGMPSIALIFADGLFRVKTG